MHHAVWWNLISYAHYFSKALPDGGIILEGNKFLWSTGQPLYADKNLKIEAKNLGPAEM
jgi:hypothetical protein